MKEIQTQFDPRLERFDRPREEFQSFERKEFGITNFVTGALIFCPSRLGRISAEAQKDSIQEPRVLLLRRALSDAFGGTWDYPGGSWDDSDPDIFSATAREVLEETGLKVSRFTDFVRMYMWGSPPAIIGKTWAKYTFIVEVEDDDVLKNRESNTIPIKLSSDEHMAYEWVTAADVRRSAGNDEHARKFLSAEMSKVILEGFEIEAKMA